MSKCGQAVQGAGGSDVRTYMSIHTHTYSTPSNPTPLHTFYKKSVFELYYLFSSWKKAKILIAYLKQTAHKKHLMIGINNLKVFKHLKVFPLDGIFKVDNYTENFPENRPSWPSPNNIQVLLILKSDLPLD